MKPVNDAFRSLAALRKSAFTVGSTRRFKRVVEVFSSAFALI